MMKTDGYSFWKNVDQSLGKVSLTELAEKSEINYKTLKNQRSDNRIPKAEDIYAMAQTLKVSMEYLLTGETPSTYTPRTPQVKAIFDGILHATQAELDIIYRIIVKEEPAETQNIKNA